MAWRQCNGCSAVGTLFLYFLTDDSFSDAVPSVVRHAEMHGQYAISQCHERAAVRVGCGVQLRFHLPASLGGDGCCLGNRRGLHLHLAADYLVCHLPRQNLSVEMGQGTIPLGVELRDEGRENQPAHCRAVNFNERRTDHQHHHRGTAGQRGHRRPFVCHHGRKPVLHAGLWHRRRSNHPCGPDLWRRTQRLVPQFCPSHGGLGHERHGGDGRHHVCVCARDDRPAQPRCRYSGARSKRVAHRSLRRTLLCGLHRHL